jgi:hypothetical protein
MWLTMRVVLVLLFLVRFAHADVGVVVTGDPNMQARVVDQIQRWLQDKKYELVAAPLGQATTALVDCFVMEDVACARKVFNENAKATTVVFVRVDMTTAQSRDFTLTAYWFTKGAEPAADRRNCVNCDDTALNATVDSLMRELSRKGAQGKGRIKIAGDRGIIVKIDGEEVGEPPIDREVTAGQHELVFLHGGEPVDVRRVDVDAGATVDLAAPHVPEKKPPPTTGKRSRLLPALLLIGGLAAVATGGVFLYYGSLRGPDEPYVYTNATEIGLPLALAGAFAVGASTSLFFAGSGNDAQVGVQGQF